MTQHVQAIYESGVLRPLAPLRLDEREVVSISVVNIEPRDKGDSANATLFDVFNEAGLIGCVKNAPADLSTNPKHMEGFGGSGN